MKRRLLSLAILLTAAVATACGEATYKPLGPTPTPTVGPVSFHADVAPILRDPSSPGCANQSCHFASANHPAISGLALDSSSSLSDADLYDHLKAGGALQQNATLLDVNTADVASSALLKLPSAGTYSHQILLDPDGLPYKTIAAWISSGALLN